MADTLEDKTSEDYKSLFPFGTRFPYSKSEADKEKDWVSVLDKNGIPVDSTYRYSTGKQTSDDTGISEGFSSESNATFLLNSGGNELVEAVPASKISNEHYYYKTIGGAFAKKPVAYFSVKDGQLYATVFDASGIDASKSVEMKDMLYKKIGENNYVPIDSPDDSEKKNFNKIIAKVEKYMKGNTAVQLGNIELRDLSGIKKNENDEHLAIYQEGRGKFLDLRIYNGNVAGIMSLLGKDFLRTDNLFLNSHSWKVNPKNTSIEVHDNVQLIPDNYVFKSGIKYTLGQATEVTNSGPFKVINNLAGGAAMIDAISKALKSKDKGAGLQNVSFNERINRFRNIPYFKDMDNVCIDSLNFSFQYGQFGLYDCKEEVVKPILQLASIFSYNFVDETGKEKDSSTGLYIDTPYTNKFEVMTKMYNSLFKGAKSAVNIALNSKPSVSTLNSLPKQIVNIVNTAAQENNTQVFTFRIGSSVYGPFYASDVRWEFEYERTNKDGLPFAGNIVISGIKQLLIESFEGLLSTGGQILGGGQQ